MEKYKSRADVPLKYQWDLTDFFQNEKEWESEYNKVLDILDDLEQYRGKLNDAFELEKYLLLDVDISNRIMELYVYAYLSLDVDLENATYIEMKEKAISLDSKYEVINAFALPEIFRMNEEEFLRLFDENKNLEKFRRYLEDIYEKKKHILSEEEEKVVSLLSETYSSYSNISSTILNSEHDYGKVRLSSGEEVDITSTNLGLLKRNRDSRVRKEASEKFGKVISRYQNTESALLNYHVKNSYNLAKLRKYESAWQESLEKKHLDSKIFESLQNVFLENICFNHKYFQLMKNVLGLDILHNYDTLLEWSNFDKEYSIEEAEKIVLDSLKILGDDYLKKVARVFENHYIDYCQYKGKASGGYSYSTARHDSRILMSFNGKIGNIFTIIHEVGHHVHHQYLNEFNEEWYRFQPNTVAEVVSLTNEIILADYLYKNGKTKSERLIGLENFVQTFQNNFFSAVMQGQLELKMYEQIEKGNSVTAKFLNEEVEKLLDFYQGGIIENDKYAKLLWVTRSHYYMNFYLFNYAICICVATFFARRIIEGDDLILSQYQEFMKKGSYLHPMEVFEEVGIDLTKRDIYEEAVQYFNSQLDLYEKLSKEGE